MMRPEEKACCEPCGERTCKTGESAEKLFLAAQSDDKDALEALTLRNMGLVHAMASRYAGRGCDMEDLIQLGALGLCKAILRFDPSRGVQFSTCAVPWIVGEIRRYFRNDGMLRVSRGMKELGRKVEKAREDMEKTGRQATPENLAQQLGTTPEEILLAMESRTPCTSLEAEMEATEQPRQMPADPKDAYLESDMHILLEQGLDKRARAVLELRYYGRLSQAETARRLCISQPQISRIENKALNALRCALKEDPERTVISAP